MDPDDAFHFILERIKAGDSEEAIEWSEDLARWLASGGFEPAWRRILLEAVTEWND